MFAIGPYRLRNPVALAPMAGISDAPFRQLAWRYGVGYMVGEMTDARPELWHTDKSTLRRAPIAREAGHSDAPHAVQIAGADAQWLATSARRSWQAGAQIIDINFGCPAKKVCRKAAGSALLADPALVARLSAAVVAAVPVPVTVKMRTGSAPQTRNAVDIALRLQDVGVAAIALHGRTRACKFAGAAEYDTIAAVKARVDLPVFANGDIADVAGALSVLRHTGADGVMIGRAALGAPWLPGWLAAGLQAASTGGKPPAAPGLGQRLRLLREQVAAIHDFYGAQRGVRIARKHVQWTLTHPSLPVLAVDQRARLKQLSSACVKIEDALAQLDALDTLEMRVGVSLAA